MLVSSVAASRVIVSAIIMNFGEKSTVRMRMILDASHVTARLVKMKLSVDFLSYDPKQNLG